MWKHISFPDNQDVMDLIDVKHTGVLALLDEQCILPKSTDEKFTRCLCARCDIHPRFSATSAQRVDCVFSIEHCASLVEHTADSWLEKNEECEPMSAVDEGEPVSAADEGELVSAVDEGESSAVYESELVSAVEEAAPVSAEGFLEGRCPDFCLARW
jgi:hypothetical protein